MSDEQAQIIDFRLSGIEFLLKKNENAHIPEVYINAKEVCRLLNITLPTIYQLINEKIITLKNSSKNCYLLTEILWIKGEKYKNLSVYDIQELRTKKSKFYGTI